jgi:hypothetical protein
MTCSVEYVKCNNFETKVSVKGLGSKVTKNERLGKVQKE